MSTALRDIVSLTKPRLSGLVIFTAGGGLVLAPGSMPVWRAIGTLLATSLVVGSANAFNCYIERDLDQHMERTRSRPLPSGRLEPAVALWVGAILGLLALPALAYFSNLLTASLGLLGLLSYVFAYTPMKQKSAMALWVGAIPGAIPPLMGWTAVRGRVELAGLVLAAVLFCWQIPHFIAVGIARREDYARAGHKILPLVATDKQTKMHALAWTLLLVIATLALKPLGVVGKLFDAAAMILGAFFLSRVILGFVQPEGDLRWARKVFLGSLVYLTALFAILAIDAR